MVNIQPEVASGGGDAGSSQPPTSTRPQSGAAAGEGSANAVISGDASAPEEKAEPSIPEVALVPLPPNFGKTDV